MKEEQDMFGNTGLQFFGKISASLSHELKNALAVINENAGLLTDLVHMSEKGYPLDPERVRGVGSKVMERVRQADSILKNMNAFAHSVDIPVAPTDLGDTLNLLISLTRRLTSNRGISVSLIAPESPLSISTSAYRLIHLCWSCLDASLAWVGEEKAVCLIPEKTAEGARIRFTRLDNLPQSPDFFPGEKEKSLLSALKAEISGNPKAGEVVLSLPLSLS